MLSLHSPSSSPNAQLPSDAAIAHAATSTGRLQRGEFLLTFLLILAWQLPPEAVMDLILM